MGFIIEGGDERGKGSGGAQADGVIEGWLYVVAHPGRDKGESDSGGLVEGCD